MDTEGMALWKDQLFLHLGNQVKLLELNGWNGICNRLYGKFHLPVESKNKKNLMEFMMLHNRI